MTEPAAVSSDPNVYRATLKGLRPVVVTVLAFSAAINVLMLTGSVYMLQVYDRVLSSGSVPTLLALFGIVVVLFAFLAVYDFLRARMLSRAALRLDHHSSGRAFHTFVRSGLPDGAGGAQGQPLQDIETLRGVIGSPAATAVFDLPFVPLFVAVLFIIHPWLGALTVAGASIAALFAVMNRALIQKAIDQSASIRAQEQLFSDTSRRNAESIIAMGMQRAISSRWHGLHQASLANIQSGSDPSEGIAAASRAFRMLLQSAILTLGAFLVLKGQITAGMIIASSILSGRALAPIDQMIGQWRTIGRAMAAHKRLDALFANVAAEPERINLPMPTGEITVTGLTKLGSPKAGLDRARILSDLSFTLKSGEGLGVIGNSASGKSTLARLLVGAGGPDMGEIRLDGATLDQWEPARLGRAIGYLPQNVELLPGTIRDNIARFDTEARDADVIAAAKLTGIHDMVLGLSDGYATEVGIPGEAMPLSGGQIQRVGLARAIFGSPKIVVLDEPNSNLDVAGDEALTRAISTLLEAGSTVIVMAHRPSALSALTKLMVLDNGSIKLFGEKDKILAKTGQAPAPKPVAQPVTKSGPNAAIRPTPKLASKPEQKPPAQKPVAPLAPQAASSATAKPADKPVAKPMVRPVQAELGQAAREPAPQTPKPAPLPRTRKAASLATVAVPFQRRGQG